MSGPHGSTRTVPKRKGSPSRREIEHVQAIRQAALPLSGEIGLDIRDRKGGDLSEWPADLRVREFPRTGVPA